MHVKSKRTELRCSILFCLQLIDGKCFFISTILISMIVCLSSLDKIIQLCRIPQLFPKKYHISFLLNAITSRTFSPFISMVAILPFAGTYVEETKSKFVRYYLIRSNYTEYILSRILLCFLCGGGVVLSGSLLSWGISALLLIPMETLAEIEVDSTAELWITLGLLFLSGGLWAVIGMAMSTFMESKYIAYASPFVIYYMLVILCERYFPDAYLLYPPNWTNPDVWPYGAWGVAIFLLELTLVFSILFVIRAGRRLWEL